MAADPQAGFDLRDAGDGDTLLLTFGSMIKDATGEPPYALVNSCTRLKQRLDLRFAVGLARARRNDWYLGGIATLGTDIPTTGEKLREVCERYRRVICVGNSMGGYAALVFGAIIDADRVIAFSPQTRIDPAFRKRIGDARWQRDLGPLARDHDTEAWAVARVWEGRAASPPPADIYVGADCAQDVAHGVELGDGFANVRLIEVAGTNHDLVHQMRASTALEDVIARAITDDAPAALGA